MARPGEFAANVSSGNRVATDAESFRSGKAAIVPASPPKITTYDDAREAVRDAEVQALTKRVRQLEDEVGSQGSGSNYLYYCPDSAVYYPDAQTCPNGWLQVVPNRSADSSPGSGQ